MSFIDFTKVEELPEGITPELLSNDSIQNFIKDQFETTYQKRFETETSGLKKTNEQIKEEKRKLKEHLDKYQGIDMDEYAQLQEFKKNNGDATKQLEVLQAEKEAIRQAAEQQVENERLQLQQVTNDLYTERLTNRASGGIREHNAKYPTVSVKDGADRWIMEEAKNVWKRGEDGEFTPMAGDRVMTGPSGDVMTFPEWVNSLRDRAEFQPLFNAPTGGGAGGSSGSHKGTHFNPKDLAGSKDERTAAIRAKFNL